MSSVTVFFATCAVCSETGALSLNMHTLLWNHVCVVLAVVIIVIVTQTSSSHPTALPLPCQRPLCAWRICCQQRPSPPLHCLPGTHNCTRCDKTTQNEPRGLDAEDLRGFPCFMGALTVVCQSSAGRERLISLQMACSTLRTIFRIFFRLSKQMTDSAQQDTCLSRDPMFVGRAAHFWDTEQKHKKNLMSTARTGFFFPLTNAHLNLAEENSLVICPVENLQSCNVEISVNLQVRNIRQTPSRCQDDIQYRDSLILDDLQNRITALFYSPSYLPDFTRNSLTSL